MTEQPRLRAQDVEWREVEGEIVVLDLRTSRYLAINSSGAVLWRALIEGSSAGDLEERLIESFGIEREQASADVKDFLDDLESRGLLEG